MHKIEIPTTSKVLNFPENAGELTPEQFLGFSGLVFLYATKKIDYMAFSVKATYHLLNMKRTANIEDEANAQVLENVLIISKLIDGFFETQRKDGKEIKVLKMDFYDQKLPTIKVGNTVFYGPDDALFNTVYSEYLQVVNYLNMYALSGDEEHLNLLIATVYRPKKENYDQVKHQPDFDGDIRVKFNTHHTAEYAKTIKNLPFNTRYAVFLFLASCNHFISNTSNLDIGSGNTIDLTILFNKNTTGASPKNSLGLVGTLFSLAETKVFGSVKEVATENTYDILAFLVKQTTEMEALKNKNKNHDTTT